MSSGKNFDSAPAPISGDDALMRGIAAGDLHAFEQFYDRHSPRVLAFCLRMIGDRSEAEDLVVDIFWELWHRQDRYQPHRSGPVTYLMKVARSRAIDRLRCIRGKRIHMSAASVPGLASQSNDIRGPVEQAVSDEQEAALREALNQLSPDQRQALELAYFDAMSYSQVADSLGQPLGTVKSRIRQALKQLRDLLKGPDG